MADSPEVQAILARGKISAEDVLQLRQRVFLKGVVTTQDAEMAFALNDRLGENADPSWGHFFVEALTDYTVEQAEPQGYVSEAKADWLISNIARSGHVDTLTELNLLVKVLEKSKQSPTKLIRFALDQVHLGVVGGKGTVGRNHNADTGAITEAEVELVRRMLYAFGGSGNIAVTKEEAEVLFDINDATSEVDNHPAWSDLFVKALANFFMATSGYQVPSRTEALRREAWLDAPSPAFDDFMSRMLAGSLDAVWNAYQHGSLDGEPAKPAVAAAEPRVTPEEIRWAVERIGRDGLHENEIALIQFLRKRDAHLHPKLKPILELAA
jgi:hypothetical protein